MLIPTLLELQSTYHSGSNPFTCPVLWCPIFCVFPGPLNTTYGLALFPSLLLRSFALRTVTMSVPGALGAEPIPGGRVVATPPAGTPIDVPSISVGWDTCPAGKLYPSGSSDSGIMLPDSSVATRTSLPDLSFFLMRPILRPAKPPT